MKRASSIRIGTIGGAFLLVPLFALQWQQPNQVDLNKPEVRMGGMLAEDLVVESIIDYAWISGERFYLLDVKQRKVFVFSSTGEFLLEFGRAGQGPGEFQQPWDIEVGTRHVYILDRRANRISRFTHDGEYVDSIILQQPSASIALHGGDLFVSVRSQSSLLWRFPGSDLDSPENFLQGLRERALRAEIEDVPVHSSPEIYTLGNLLGISFPTAAKVGLVSLRDSTFVKILDLQSESIGAHRTAFAREHVSANEGTRSLSPKLLGDLSMWDDDTMLLDAYPTGAESIVSMAELVSIESGSEEGLRFISYAGIYWKYRRVGRHLIAAINHELATLDLFYF